MCGTYGPQAQHVYACSCLVECSLSSTQYKLCHKYKYTNIYIYTYISYIYNFNLHIQSTRSCEIKTKFQIQHWKGKFTEQGSINQICQCLPPQHFHTIQYHVTGDMQALTSSYVGQSWLQYATYVTSMLYNIITFAVKLLLHALSNVWQEVTYAKAMCYYYNIRMEKLCYCKL